MDSLGKVTPNPGFLCELWIYNLQHVLQQVGGTEMKCSINYGVHHDLQ